MGWLKDLSGLFKGIVEINAKGAKIDVRLFNFNIDNQKITITNSGNRQVNNKAIYKRGATVYIDLAQVKDEQKKKLKPIIKEYLDSSDEPLLEVETDKLLENLDKYAPAKEGESRRIVEFFHNIIPPNDLEALEAALYLRSAFERREGIDKMRKDIRCSFGSRGANITKLCSARYFEGFLIPMYNTLSEEGEMGKRRFNELYELTVGKAALTVFVYEEMTPEEIQKQIAEKIEISKKYGIRFINIHGIGTNNAAKIKQCMEDRKDFFKSFERKIVFEKENIIILELIF
ncbi:MAG: hypothetical protein ABH854_00590 [Candidatus Diapherotrites archaeon]